MPNFEVIVLGCGGGPSEHNLSSYLFKPYDAHWSDGIIAVEAGSGIGTLEKVMHGHSGLFSRRPVENRDSSSPTTAAQVYSWIRCFLISHAHLDHINGLALTATTIGGSPRTVFGTRRCLENIETLFSGQLWPQLASWDGNTSLPLRLKELPGDARYHSISPEFSVRAMPLSHGTSPQTGHYPSSAFFVRHDPSVHEFLFFGDVEPDSVAEEPRNRDVWRAAAPKIPEALDTIFIECSYPSGRADDMLYGHLSPEHLSTELTALAAEVVDTRTRIRQPSGSQEWDSEDEPIHTRKRRRQEPQVLPSLRGALDGVRVYIIHCKDDIHRAFAEPIQQIIASQVRVLVAEQGLGAEIIAVQQGMRICI